MTNPGGLLPYLFGLFRPLRRHAERDRAVALRTPPLVPIRCLRESGYRQTDNQRTNEQAILHDHSVLSAPSTFPRSAARAARVDDTTPAIATPPSRTSSVDPGRTPPRADQAGATASTALSTPAPSPAANS